MKGWGPLLVLVGVIAIGMLSHIVGPWLKHLWDSITAAFDQVIH